MLYALALLGLAAPFVQAAPQVTAHISPHQPAPSGCVYTYNGLFDLAKAVNPGKRGLERRAGNAVQLTLVNGYMQDPTGYVAYIASNYQFQFDRPPQAGAIYTAGFSICPNHTIALGNTAVFYQCSNGSGAFNIYYQQATGLKCSPIFLEAIPVSGTGGVTSQAPSVIPSYTPPATSAPASSAPASSAPATSAPATSAPASSAPATSPPASTPMSSAMSSPMSSAVMTSAPPATGTVPVTSSPASSVAPTLPPNAAPVASYSREMFALAVGAIGAALL